MASQTTDQTVRRGASSFLNLPAEIRCQIYSNFPTDTIEVNFCAVLSQMSECEGDRQRKASPLLRYLRTQAEVASTTRALGLHLMAVHPLVSAEMLPLYKNTILQPHCPECLDRLISHLLHDLGLNFEVQILPVIRHLHHYFMNYRQVSSSILGGSVWTLVKEFRQVLCRHYGSWIGLQDDSFDMPVQKWTLEKRTIYKINANGKLIGRHSQDERTPSASTRDGHHTMSANISFVSGVNPVTLQRMELGPSRQWVIESEDWCIVADLDCKVRIKDPTFTAAGGMW